jgi:hypothetical protein
VQRKGWLRKFSWGGCFILKKLFETEVNATKNRFRNRSFPTKTGGAITAFLTGGKPYFSAVKKGCTIKGK